MTCLTYNQRTLDPMHKLQTCFTKERALNKISILYTVYKENFVPVLFSPVSSSGLRWNLKLGQLINIDKNVEWANSRMGESVSDPNRAKISLEEFKAVCMFVIILV